MEEQLLPLPPTFLDSPPQPGTPESMPLPQATVRAHEASVKPAPGAESVVAEDAGSPTGQRQIQMVNVRKRDVAAVLKDQDLNNISMKQVRLMLEERLLLPHGRLENDDQKHKIWMLFLKVMKQILRAAQMSNNFTLAKRCAEGI